MSNGNNGKKMDLNSGDNILENYNSSGFNVNELSFEERSKAISILKKEFISN